MTFVYVYIFILSYIAKSSLDTQTTFVGCDLDFRRIFRLRTGIFAAAQCY